MFRAKFFSENDLSCGESLTRIVEILTNYDETLKLDIVSVLEFYNVLKFVKFERFKKRIEEEADIDINNFVKITEKRIGLFIASCKENYLDFYKSIDFPYYKDFFEVMDKYKIYQNIRSDDLQGFLTRNRARLHYVLENKDIVHYHDEIIKNVLLDDPNNAEIVLDKYLSERNLYLPDSLNNYEIECLLNSYLELEHKRQIPVP